MMARSSLTATSLCILRQLTAAVARDLTSVGATAELRATLTGLITEEERLLVVRQQRIERADVVADLGTLGAMLGIIASVLLVLRWVVRGVRDLARLADA